MPIEPTKVTSTDVIKNKALMVRLSRSKMNRNKTDKAMSAEVCKLKGVTESGAVRVNKSLFPKSVTDKYMKVYSEAGKYFYRVTLPWDDKGWRLLSVDIYKDFVKKYKAFTGDYRTHVVDFIEHINDHLGLSEQMLKDAYDKDDYKFISPNGSIDTEMLMNEFSLEVEYSVVADGDDLRASINEADKEVIAEQINKNVLAKFQRANEHIITVLHEAILAIHERLCEKENVFRDTLISNLEELVDLIPKMNIANDPAINALAAEAKQKLAGWDPQVLREDDVARKKVSDDAKKMLDNMAGVI